MTELFTSRILVPALVFVLVVLVLYGTLFWLLGLERFDMTSRSTETVRIIN